MTHHEITNALVRELSALDFGPPVARVYNPLAYARASHDLYWERFGRGRKAVLLLGMNPGPFGMAQTGVPFGAVEWVRDWMGIEAPVGEPPDPHPKRPVQGFACPRSEVSGSRLWGWARARFGAAEAFFARFFVANYCPLLFVEESGRNRTPDKLPGADREPLFRACDRALEGVLELLRPELAVGVGRFAEERLHGVAPGLAHAPRIGRISHPSPANPAANRGWAGLVERELRELGVAL